MSHGIKGLGVHRFHQMSHWGRGLKQAKKVSRIICMSENSKSFCLNKRFFLFMLLYLKKIVKQKGIFCHQVVLPSNLPIHYTEL